MQTPENLIGQSAAIRDLLKMIHKVARTDSTILILGESGTGKELVARHIHSVSSRVNMPFVPVNCAAFNDLLLESELFGYRKGAFTGATENKAGLFQMAHGGTLFLDEVAEMSADMQKKLLRILEDGIVRPLGSGQPVQTNVRTIGATNKNLKELAERGKFREDLYFRLNAITLSLPPLRERRQDVPLLIEHYTRKICSDLNRTNVNVPETTLRLFCEYDWPGNVRELINELRRVIILESQYNFQRYEPFHKKAFEEPAPEATPENVLPLSSMERQMILNALEKAGGNKSRAAELLGIARRTLYQKLKRFQLL